MPFISDRSCEVTATACQPPSYKVASLGLQVIASPNGQWVCFANEKREVFARRLLPELAPPLALGVRVRSVEAEGFASGLIDYASFAARPNRLIVAAEDAVHVFDFSTGVERILSPWAEQGMPLVNVAQTRTPQLDLEEDWIRLARASLRDSA